MTLTKENMEENKLTIAELLTFYENRIIKKETDRGSEIERQLYRLINLRNLQIVYR